MGRGGDRDQDGTQSLSEEMSLRQVKESFPNSVRREEIKDEYEYIRVHPKVSSLSNAMIIIMANIY